MIPDYTSICAEVVEMIRRGDSSVPSFLGNDWRKVGLEWVFRFDVFCFTSGLGLCDVGSCFSNKIIASEFFKNPLIPHRL
jgi:hypothetical protein